MWIQVRTMDGKVAHTVDSLSRLTKVEELRKKIQELFHVEPGLQRLFYRGKQMEDGHTLFDYDVRLNDTIQLLVRQSLVLPVPVPSSSGGSKERDSELSDTDSGCGLAQSESDKSPRKGKRKSKSAGGDGSSRGTPKKTKVEPYSLTTQQSSLIKEDKSNMKLWTEILKSLKDGPKFLSKVEETFQCICCQELVFRPITTVCQHNVCKDCLDRSFKAQVFSCPACRYDLGRSYAMTVNQPLQAVLSQLFPGYGSGR